MPTPMTRVMVFSYLLAGVAPTAEAQVDQQRAQEYFKEARPLRARRRRSVGRVAVRTDGDRRHADADDRHQPARTRRDSAARPRYREGPFRASGDWGTLEAEKGVLVASDGRSRRVPAPTRRDDGTFSGDGWTFKSAPGWVVREGARRGDYEVVR